MKAFVFNLFVFLLVSILPVKAQERQDVPYTLADRDRIIRIEARMEALETKMDVKFESQQRQLDDLKTLFDDLKTLFYWGFSILITLFLFMLGYIIWDRRTALRPATAMDQAYIAKENTRNLTTVLREYAKKHPDLAEILKVHGLW